MTDSNWKPVPHSTTCRQRPGECITGCNGTRWVDYGERTKDWKGVAAFAQGMARLGGEAVPVAWRFPKSHGSILADGTHFQEYYYFEPAQVAGSGRGRQGLEPVYTHPPAAAPSEDARDAARYRFIRENDEVPNIWSYMGDSLDAAIDAAMSETASQEKGS